jgi:hypothetical protein
MHELVVDTCSSLKNEGEWRRNRPLDSCEVCDMTKEIGSEGVVFQNVTAMDSKTHAYEIIVLFNMSIAPWRIDKTNSFRKYQFRTI